jgi:hypothetical protein
LLLNYPAREVTEPDLSPAHDSPAENGAIETDNFSIINQRISDVTFT